MTIFIRIKPDTLEGGEVGSDTGKDRCSGKMDVPMKAVGIMVTPARESLAYRAATYTAGVSPLGSSVGEAPTGAKMVPSTREVGSMGFATAQVGT